MSSTGSAFSNLGRMSELPNMQQFFIQKSIQQEGLNSSYLDLKIFTPDDILEIRTSTQAPAERWSKQENFEYRGQTAPLMVTASIC